MSRNDVILGLVALVLVVFSLVSAILIPRRYEDFPGRKLRLFAVVSVLLVVAMLGAVEILGEGHEPVHAAEEEHVEPGGPPAPPAPEAPEPTEGDPEAGREVFLTAEPSCGGCHAFEAAETTGAVGPNLDESLRGKDAEYVHTAIVDPEAQVTEGFQPGVMPNDYGEKLSEEQIADLVAFLLQMRAGERG